MLMPRPSRLLILLALISTPCFAQTPSYFQPVKELIPNGTLATCGYTPVDQEAPFYKKLSPDEQDTGSMMKGYELKGKKKKYVSWFGIVRGISEAQKDGKITLLLEQKAFDGLTDCHIMLVSKNGGGDFQVTLGPVDGKIPALALVRVYGTVTDEVNGVPHITAEYIRVWPWLTFTFTDLGPSNKGNPRWAKYCQPCKGGRVYKPYPTNDYYLQVLGDPKDFGLNLKDQ
jgi:hypothetical protein